MQVELVRNNSTRGMGPIDPRVLACHTAVLAQSGSGKSFLVGRLIEELLIKTKARLLILDPNSDFVRLPEVDETVWRNPRLKPWFFRGDTAAKFKGKWGLVKPIILSNRNIPPAHALRIHWGGLSDLERASIMDFEPVAEPELYWSLVLAGEVARERWRRDDEVDYDFEHFRQVANDVCDFVLGKDGTSDITQKPIASLLRTTHSGVGLRLRALVYALESFEIWRAVGDQEKDISDIIGDDQERPSAIVVDLLSVETEEERLALTARALATIWKRAREAYSATLRDIGEPDRRVPTIIVIDEAHNIVPIRRMNPAAERVAADLIQIAAEGRKFGLFLLVITQRPRKLDPSILSECDGLFLMRITNETDIKQAAELFGFLGPSAKAGAKKLGIGEVYLQGRLSGGDRVWHVAPRRTMQGGKSLDEDYWTSA